MWAAAWYECSEMRGSVVFTGARLGNRPNKRGNRALAQLPHPPSTSHSSHCFGLASGLAEPCRCERRMPFYARHHSCEQLNRRAYPAEGATNGAGMLLHALKGGKPTCSTIAVFLVQKNLVLVILRTACDRLRRMRVLHNLFAIFFLVAKRPVTAPLWPFLQPRNGSWTRPNGPSWGCAGKARQRSGLLPARWSNAPSAPQGGSVGRVAQSPNR